MSKTTPARKATPKESKMKNEKKPEPKVKPKWGRPELEVIPMKQTQHGTGNGNDGLGGKTGS